MDVELDVKFELGVEEFQRPASSILSPGQDAEQELWVLESHVVWLVIECSCQLSFRWLFEVSFDFDSRHLSQLLFDMCLDSSLEIPCGPRGDVARDAACVMRPAIWPRCLQQPVK